MTIRWPVSVEALGHSVAGARLWKGPRSRHLTVVVKATVELVHEARAKLVAPEALVDKDRHYQASPGRSVEHASDLAPYLARCDVTVRGHAHAPPGQSVTAATVRVSIFRGVSILDKKLYVYGDRDPATPDRPAPFQRMAVDYEHALGGRANKDNPVGRGGDKPGAPTVLPNVVDAVDASRIAGFAPLSRFWGERTRALGAQSRGVVDAEEAELPDGFDWRYYQAAPSDQQIPYLAGDEWIVIDGMHPALPRVSSQLPSLKGAALVYAPAGDGYGPAQPVTMLADTLAIDADRLIASISWRGSIVLAPGVDLSRLRVFGSVAPEGAPIPWPSPRSLERPAPEAAAQSQVPAGLGDGTVALSPEEALAAARAKAAPFSPPSGHAVAAPPPPSASAPSRDVGETITLRAEQRAPDRDALPFAGPPPPSAPPQVLPTPSTRGVPIREREPVAEPPPVVPFAKAPPPPAPPSLEETFRLSPRQSEDAAKAEATPFKPGDPDAPPPIIPRAARFLRDEPADLGGTVSLRPGDLAMLGRDSAPSWISRARPRSPHSARSAARAPGRIPERESPQVPIVHLPSITAATTAWQLEPPQDSLTIVAKASFAIVPGGKATLLDEPEPLSGDRFVDDDPERLLLYATDFAVTKPRADVLLTGSAFAPGGSATHARVAFKWADGRAPRGFERTLAVVGDRTWRGSSPSSPAPFSEMPLTWDRAFGGPRFADNPIGVGHGTSNLPNLEDPTRAISASSDTPMPICFGPIPSTWRERRGRLGTYGGDYHARRWPYYPADFDPLHLQSAPAAQQVDHLVGDEAFEISGMHPEHPVLRGALPGVRLRAFALTTEAAGAEFFEIELRADTA
ncbi:MAG TPA: DUF2169 domain-containing protein, partial [Polyangiaceae bacterium]|nr:DUF2169 domain-containing protein [Polyangiaceae bacterium]